MDEATGELGGDEPGAPDTWDFRSAWRRVGRRAFFSTPMPRTRKIAIRSAMTFSPDREGSSMCCRGWSAADWAARKGPARSSFSWIHEDDFARAIDFLIAHEEFSGIVDLAAPNPLPNRDFLRALREAWGVGFGLAAPVWMIEIGTWMMRTESELVLKSRRVVPGRLLSAGFRFLFQVAGGRSRPGCPSPGVEELMQRELVRLVRKRLARQPPAPTESS